MWEGFLKSKSNISDNTVVSLNPRKAPHRILGKFTATISSLNCVLPVNVSPLKKTERNTAYSLSY